MNWCEGGAHRRGLSRAAGAFTGMDFVNHETNSSGSGLALFIGSLVPHGTMHQVLVSKVFEHDAGAESPAGHH